MSVKINTHQIVFSYLDKPIKTVRMNKRVQAGLEAACLELRAYGYTEIATLGIICNRMMRSGYGTSLHSEGNRINGYKHWEDGSHGSRAIDIVAIVHSDPAKTKLFNTDRKWMIAFWQKHGFTVYHKGVKGDPKSNHIHIEM